MQALAAFVVVCAAAPVLVQWGARGELGGGVQVMLPLRMLVFVMLMNVDWAPATVGLVACAFIAALVVALKCACVDWSLLVIADCVVCAVVLAERWCWCVSVCCPSTLVLFTVLRPAICVQHSSHHATNSTSHCTHAGPIRCFRMRSIWFENLVVDAMAAEACCILKANLSGATSSVLCVFVMREVTGESEQKTLLDSSRRVVRDVKRAAHAAAAAAAAC
jgi:hypothetical protein